MPAGAQARLWIFPRRDDSTFQAMQSISSDCCDAFLLQTKLLLQFTHTKGWHVFCLQRGTHLSNWNTCQRGEGMLRKGSAGLELSSQRLWICHYPATALCRSVRLGAGPGPKGGHLRAVLLWKGWEVRRRGNLPGNRAALWFLQRYSRVIF